MPKERLFLLNRRWKQCEMKNQKFIGKKWDSLYK